MYNSILFLVWLPIAGARRDVFVALGDNVTLECKPQLYWFSIRSQHRLRVPATTMVNNRLTYTIINVSSVDAGDYYWGVLDELDAVTMGCNHVVVDNATDYVPGGCLVDNVSSYENFTIVTKDVLLVSMMSKKPDETAPNTVQILNATCSDSGRYYCRYKALRYEKETWSGLSSCINLEVLVPTPCSAPAPCSPCQCETKRCQACQACQACSCESCENDATTFWLLIVLLILIISNAILILYCLLRKRKLALEDTREMKRLATVVCE